MPPWPGNKLPESFNFASLFIIDSIRSPTKAINDTIIPKMKPINIELFQLKINANIIPVIIEHIIPPKSPSNVLLGEMGERNVFPNFFPMKYEPISLETIKKHVIKVILNPVKLL